MTIQPDWLIALAQTAPLRMPSSFEQNTQHLHRNGTYGPVPAVEDELIRYAPGLSVSAIEQLCALAWFREGQVSVSVLEVLRRAASHVLEDRGGVATVRDGFTDEPGSAHAGWRHRSLLLPTDLWVAACCVDSPSLRASGVRVDGPALGDLLARGVANTHLHLKAAPPFEIVWLAAMQGVRSAEFGKALQRVRDQRSMPFGSARRFELRLLQVAIARQLLVGFLAKPDAGALTSYVEERSAAVGREHPFLGREGLMRPLVYLVRGTWPEDVGYELARLRRLLQVATPVFPKAEHLLDFVRRDSAYRGGELAVLPDADLMHRGIRFSRLNKDESFDRLFIQYLRMRNMAFRYLVHEPGTAGLDWFARFYDRAAPFTDNTPLSDHLLDVALTFEARGVALQALEVRRTPKPAWAENRRVLAEQQRVLRNHSLDVELGTVFHFIRRRAYSARRGLRAGLIGDPRDDAFGVRFGEWVDGRMGEALALATWMKMEPIALCAVRGIDAASAELAIPTWCLRPMYRALRSLSDRLAPVTGAKGLGLTCHAGEDFRTPLEGLRRVHEALSILGFRAGDRIGHGLALGVDVRAFATKCRVHVQPREDRLADLLWELDRYTSSEVDPQPGRVLRVQREIEGLAEVTFGKGHTIAQITEAFRFLTQDALVHAGYPRRLQVDSVPPLVAQFLTDRRTFRRGTWPVSIELDQHEVESAVRCQSWLRSLIMAHELTIEMNPSSNLLVGALGTLEQHPAFLAVPTNSNEPALWVSLSDDDPLTFATSLRDEYALMYGALRTRGVCQDDAMQWLERARVAGLRSRFTFPGAAAKLHAKGQTTRQ